MNPGSGFYERILTHSQIMLRRQKMKMQNRIVHVLFVLALLLGLTPLTGNAPRAQAAALSVMMAETDEPSSRPAPGALRGPQSPTATLTNLHGVSFGDNPVGAGGWDGQLYDPSCDPTYTPSQANSGGNPVYPDTPGPIQLNKTLEDVNGAPLERGDTVRYTLEFNSSYPDVLPAVTISDTLPAEVTFVTATGVLSSVTPLSWYLGDVVSGTTWSAVITATVNNDALIVGDNTAQVLVNGDTTTQAIAPGGPVERTLTLHTTGTGSGSISPTVGVHSYPGGSVVTLTATPSSTSNFVGWSGDLIYPWSPVTLTLDSDKTVTATFDLKPVCSPEPWHVFLGSSGEDQLYDMITDDFCNVYVTGFSDNTWGNPVRAHAPITNTGVDPMYNHWLDANYDAFVAKLDANHNVVWNTFLGGIGYDQGYNLALDNAGHLYVAGQSHSQGDCAAEWGDPLVPSCSYYGERAGFVAQLDAATGALNWNTFIKFNSSSNQRGPDVQVDAEGNIYVLVEGSGPDGDEAYPVDNDYDYSGGAWNTQGQQIVKLDSNGAQLWSTLISYPQGSFGGDTGNCVLDGAGHLVCTVQNSATWGTPIRPYSGDALCDIAVFQLNTADGTLVWNTFLGGLALEMTRGVSSISVDADDNVYITASSIRVSGGAPVDPAELGAWVAKLDV
ncbi:MAG TPA: DUF11 domain-containing protein, partial [Chloroflexi bacterium]|nr:DUF11 domain-containing protein [Chloroflexota bacterium]